MAISATLITVGTIIADGGFRPIFLMGIPMGMIGGFAVHARWWRVERDRHTRYQAVMNPPTNNEGDNKSCEDKRGSQNQPPK